MFVEWYHAAASHLGGSEMLLLYRDNVAAPVIHSCRGKKISKRDNHSNNNNNNNVMISNWPGHASVYCMTQRGPEASIRILQIGCTFLFSGYTYIVTTIVVHQNFISMFVSIFYFFCFIIYLPSWR